MFRILVAALLALPLLLCEAEGAPQIVGGKSADIADFPYQAAILIHKTDSTGAHDFQCGGSLITSQWVLTAAHCFIDYDSVNHKDVPWLDPTTSFVFTGTTAFPSSGHIDPETISVIQAILPNENYDPSDLLHKNDNDIALVKLSKPVKRGLPIVLSEDDSAITTAVATGWGRTTEGGDTSKSLRQVELPVIPFDVCKAAESRSYFINDKMICAGRATGGIGTCQGDSGGPLAANVFGPNSVGYQNPFDRQQIGVTSFGVGCGRTDQYDVFTRVSSYITWIAATIIQEEVKESGGSNIADLLWLDPQLRRTEVQLIASASLDYSANFRSELAEGLVNLFRAKPDVICCRRLNLLSSDQLRLLAMATAVGKDTVDLKLALSLLSTFSTSSNNVAGWTTALLQKYGVTKQPRDGQSIAFTPSHTDVLWGDGTVGVFALPHLNLPPDEQQPVPASMLQQLKDVVAVGAAGVRSYTLQRNMNLIVSTFPGWQRPPPK